MTRWLFLFALCVAAWRGAEAEDALSDRVQITCQGDRIEIGNRSLARTFVLQPRLATSSITNRLTGRQFPVQGDEFALDLGQARRLTAAEFRLEAVEPDSASGQLTFLLRHVESNIHAAVVYELRPNQTFLRKRIRLETGSTYVRSVEVERLHFLGAELGMLRPDCFTPGPVAPVDHPPRMAAPGIWDIGLGQPVFVADQLFLGLEHPAGHNGRDRDGSVVLRHYPGRAGPIECKPAVLGVAADRPHERAQDAFLRYIASLRRRPVKRWVEFFFDTHQFDQQARQIIDDARDVFLRRGVRLDCVTVNGWAEPRQGIMEPPHDCPELLRLLTDYTRRELGCGLGLHVYTTGRRSPLLKDWIAARFDMAYVDPGPMGCGAYCLADPRAESLLTAHLGRYLREHGVSMYYYDWGWFACPAGDHRGHMPGYGTEAIADAFLRHLQAMRAANPQIFLCDTGWFSPWWLEWYDGVFFAGGDWNAQLDGPPAYATVDLLGTWRDRVMKQRLEARPYFPATGYINHGAISHNWMEWRNRVPQPRRAFVNYVAMMFLLGPQIAEYILALPELSEENRDDLAAVHRWGLARDDWLLADTRPIGGDPLRGEAYGFAHITQGNRGVIGLRNPTVLERSVNFVCDEKLGFWPAPGPLVAMTTYPHCSAQKEFLRYGQSLEVKLAPHELRVVEFAPQDSLPRPMTLGCREQLLESGARRTVIALLDSEGSAVPVISPVAMEEVLLDGKPCPLAPGSRQTVIQLSKAATASPAVGVADCSVRNGQTGLALRLSADVPSTCRAKLVLLVHSSQTGSSKLEATIRHAGKEVEVEAPHLHLGDSGGRTSGRQALAPDWSLFRVPLPAGRAELECLLCVARPNLGGTGDRLPPVGPWRGELRAFIDAEFDLPQTHRLEIRHPPLPAAPLPALPLHWNAVGLNRREVIAARPVTIESPQEERNLALASGATPPRVEVDSVYPSYTSAPINDGQVSPRGHAGAAWASAESPQAHFVTLTWPEKHRIGKVYICWGQADWLPRAYRVECRVDGAWIGVDPAPGAEPAWRTAAGRDTVRRFRPVWSDALRIVQQAGGGSLDRPNLMGVAEVAVYE